MWMQYVVNVYKFYHSEVSMHAEVSACIGQRFDSKATSWISSKYDVGRIVIKVEFFVVLKNGSLVKYFVRDIKL